MGTAAAVVPIKSLDKLSTGEKYVFPASGEEGNIVGLARLMGAVARGNSEDTEGWRWEVTGFAPPLTAEPAKTEFTSVFSIVEVSG